jgi:hypothetical protein
MSIQEEWMTRHIKVIGVKRKAIDEEKLALAFLLLAKRLHDQANAVDKGDEAANADAEAA